MTDYEIARSVELQPINEVAKKLGIADEELEYYGKYKAKIAPRKANPNSKLILVTATSPTKLGEGKTTVSIGLIDGLSRLGKKVCGALREPSLGPVFGMKGGATGGGRTQVAPMDDINLHFTGDLHAITTATNLLAAMIDNSIFHKNPLNIDPEKVVFTRCLDVNDRALRSVKIAKREDSFTLTAASEIMAILCLSTSLDDLRHRIENIILAVRTDGGPALYRQKRLTQDGRVFEMLKFRSMIVDAEKHSGAVLSTGENDPRITKVGKFIRALRIDELPQLWNILKGDMSIVGPRPERKVIADEYCKDIPEFAYRLKVRGGLTGYAQIYGKYNTSAYDKLRLDLMYIENYSLLLDIKLMILTIRILFSKESTEGVDKAAENQKLADELLRQLDQDS